MVNYRSELSCSRTGIHGGFRRGAVSAAFGAVLVLSAGVSSSQADDGNPDSGERDALISGTAELPAVSSLLDGLLGSGTHSGGQPSAPATTTSPAPTTSSAPAGTVAPSQAPATSPAPATSGAAPSSTAGPQPAASGTSSTPGVTLQPPIQQPGPVASQPEVASGTAADQQQTSAPPGTAGIDVPTESGAGQAASGAPSPSAARTPRSETLQAAGSPSPGRHGIAEGPGSLPEAGKVWLGVGLVGSAGAAGLVFARIRRL